MKSAIQVEGIKVRAFHGCLQEEARIGGDYIVDVELEYDFLEAAKEDNLLLTADYVDVYNIVKEEMAHRSRLIETVALRIINKIKKEIKGVEQVMVKVVKIAPPMNGEVEKVSVTLKG